MTHKIALPKVSISSFAVKTVKAVGRSLRSTVETLYLSDVVRKVAFQAIIVIATAAIAWAVWWMINPSYITVALSTDRFYTIGLLLTVVSISRSISAVKVSRK